MEIQTCFFILIVVVYEIILPSEACPKECACSQTRMDCYSRHLQKFPNDIPKSVINLDVHDNEIVEVDAKSLSHLSHLEIMSLQKNHITELKPWTFINLPKLKKLYIGNNHISHIDHNVFVNLSSMQDLDLTKNNISEITGKLNISSLERLSLSNNKITSLEDNTLNGVRNLKYLTLANNNISYISKSAFDGMAHLYYLVLSGNPIKNIDHIFKDIGSLSYLDVSSCQLKNFPLDLPWALRNLMISDNDLTAIQNHDLYSTRYLAVIILDNNSIEDIQDGALLYTPYLKDLRISHNKLKWLPQIPKNIETFTANNNYIQQLFQYNFAHDSVMKMLSLSKNKISEIPANTFSRLTKLNTLLLDHNEIKHLKNMTFANLRQLINLNLEFNPIKKIEHRAFGGLQKLQQLKLANIDTNETVIEGVIFQDIPALLNLDLQGSSSVINDVLNSSELLRSLQNIQHLNLGNGSLESLPMDTKTSLPNLKSLKLSDNPWQCDAALVELHNWINDSPKLFGNSQIVCASPSHLRGRSIQEVSIQELMFASTFTTSNILEDTVSKTTIYINEAESTDEDLIRYWTLLSKATTMASSTKVTKTENFQEISMTVKQDTDSKNILNTEQQYLLSTEHYLPHHVSLLTQSLTPLVNPPASSVSQISPSTTVFESYATSISTNGVITSPLKMPSTPFKKIQSTTFSIADTTWSITMINSGPSMKLPSPSAEEVSTTRTIDYTASTTHSTSTVISQPLISSVTINSPFNSLPDTMQASSTFSTMQSKYNFKNITTISANNTITNYEMTSMLPKFLQMEISVTNTLPYMTSKDLLDLHSSKLETSESTTVKGLSGTRIILASTEIQIATHKIQDNESIFVNSTDFDRKNHGYPTKPYIKTDNRLPTVSNSSDTKLRIITITVSISLLALAVGLFTVIVVIRQCKKRKHVSYLVSDPIPDSQTTVSDSVFIISHMAGEQSDCLNTETREDASSASIKDFSAVQNDSKLPKKLFKFNGKSLSASAIVSKSRFNCMRSQTEDESELLVYP